MTRWEALEEWLFDNETQTFTNHDLATAFGVSGPEANKLIRSYLGAQRSKEPRTLYVLKREGRTATAVWSVGQRVTDARILSNTLFEDVRVKIHRAFAPDMKRLATRNPRAARYAEAKIDQVLNGALSVMAAALDVDGYEEE